MISEKSWLQDIWNETLISQEYEVKARDYIRASEVGGSMLDRWYKMTGVKPTNPYTARTLRVFEAGNLFEWLVRLILVRSGLLTAHQQKIEVAGDRECLPVFGRLDFVGGGKPNFEEAEKIVPLLKSLYFPERMLTVADKVIETLMEKFPEGLPQFLYEVKSINSMVFWRKDRMLEKPYPHHTLQLYTYLKGTGMKEGRIIYISKDDLTIAEFSVVPDEELERKWRDDVLEISRYIKTKTKPEPEPYIKFNPDSRKFEANWQVARSNYFELITGEKDQGEWESQMKKLASRANYRIDKLTEKKPEISDEQIIAGIVPYIEAELEGKLTISKVGKEDDNEKHLEQEQALV
jgi:hypothetical protein